MKSIKKESKVKELDFPKLMIGNFTGVVVLMTEHKKGVVVFESKHREIGTYYHDWNMEDLTEFEGTIELSN